MNEVSEFKKPLNIVFLLLAILGIALSIIFHLNSIKQKEISYHIINPPSLIFDSKSATSSIHLFEKDSVRITENVYLLKGKIWNSGDFPISKEDVRSPIIIKIEKSCRILDYSITQQKDSSIANFILKQINDNQLQVDWKYFDPSYNFSFQLIYSGKSESGLMINGKVLGISTFTSSDDPAKRHPFWNWQLFLNLFNLLAWSYWCIDYYRKKSKWIWISIFFILLSAFGLWIHFRSYFSVSSFLT